MDSRTSSSAPELLPADALSPTSKWKRKLTHFGSQYGYLAFAALIPAVLVYLIYLARGHYPFGDECVLVLDLNGQYVSFYEGLYNILHGDSDLLYSFSRALGGEFLGIYDYYVASPFALILALFPQDRMLEGLLVLFLLKTAMCGLTMGIYLHKHAPDGKPNRLVVIAFSILYALSSYAIVQQHNSMWIDAVLWLPLLALGIEELIKRGKFRLYVFALAITVYSNFYIGYMVVIFTAAYCIFYYFAHNRNNENNPLGEKSHLAKSVGRVALWSVLALGIAAIAILSARYSLSFGKNEFSTPNWEITQKFDIFEFLYKFLPSSYDTVRPQGLPFVYCGVLTIIMVPAFFLSKKFSTREKIASGLFILFFVASFAVSSIDLIWHGFQKPNWLNYRYSFMLCFFLLTLAYRAFEELLYTSRKALAGIVALIALYVVVLQKMADILVEENEKLVIRPFATIWLTLGCLLVYFVLACVWGKAKERQRETVAIVLVFVVCVETFLSGSMEMQSLDKDVIFSNYSKYNDMIDTLRPITATVDEYDDGFYRMEKFREKYPHYRKTNDNFALQIKGLSNSTSTLNRDTIDFLQNMGYAAKSHWAKYLGGTAVNDSLLGIKYLITTKDMTDYYGEPIFTPADSGYPDDFKPGADDQYDVYYNPYALSFAYGVSDEWETFNMESYKDPFERLNGMVTAMLGEEETVQIFVPAIQVGDVETDNIKVGSTVDGEISYKKKNTTDDASLTYEYEVPADTEMFIYFPTGYPRMLSLSVNGKGSIEYGGGETHRIVSLGESSTGEMTIKAKLHKDNTSNNFYTYPKDSYVYYIDMDVFADAMTRLAAVQYEIDNNSTDSYLHGSVTTAAAEQLMFTSIPYDEGWKVYVDGERVEIFETADALMTFRIDDAGEHTVEMKYRPDVVILGYSISFICLGVFILLLILYPFIKKIPYLRRFVMIEEDELPTVRNDEMRAKIEPGDIGWSDDPGDDHDKGASGKTDKGDQKDKSHKSGPKKAGAGKSDKKPRR